MYPIKMTITPNVATAMLGTQTRNRRINLARVDMYKRDLEKGNWKESNDLICISENGKLLNGQHRLTAIAEYGQPVDVWVFYDCPEDMVCDVGQARSKPQALYMRGKLTDELSDRAVVGCAMRYLAVRYGKEYARRASNDDVGDFISDNADAFLSVKRFARNGASRKNCQAIMRRAGAMAALLGAILSGIPEEKLEDFAYVANTGFMANEAQSAAIVFRNYAIAAAPSGDVSANRLCAVCEMAILDFVSEKPRKRAYTTYEHRIIKREGTT